jgi:glycosyltransferase involved in cell wall biosynthesis
MSSVPFSVLMCVYIGERPEYLLAALQSVLEQTLLPDEVVLVEDGKLTEVQYGIIEDYRDKLNIVSVRNAYNIGLAASLNRGLRACRFELIIRMDSDDISRRNRFEMLVKYMCDNPRIAVCSSALSEFDDNGIIRSTRTLPLTHKELVAFGKLRSPISHAAAIFRKSVVLNVGGYPLFKRSQDVALWSLLIVKGYKLGNLKDDLFLVRAGSGFMKRSGLSNFKYEYAVIKFQYSIGYLNFYEKNRNILIRFLLAIVPVALKRWLYVAAKK